jgi:nucleoside-triphosphatase THEP1
MELLSNKFKQLIETLIERPNLILIATIPIKPLPFVDRIRTRKDCHLVTVCLQMKIHIYLF